MWISHEANENQYRLWARCDGGLFSRCRGVWPVDEVVVTPSLDGSAEVVDISWKDDKLCVTVNNRPRCLFDAARVIAEQGVRMVTPLAIEDLIAAFHREEEGLNRLLTEIDKLPPPESEIPYELLLAVYDGAESMAVADREWGWFWSQDSLHDRYRKEESKQFHEAIIAVRNWKKELEENRVGK